MGKVLVIGRGPAGISASLYIRRGGFEVTVAAKDDGALARAEKVENFYGQAEPVSGAELVRRGIAGAKRLGVNFREAEVVALTIEEKGFSAKTAVGETLTADAVVLAAGASRSAPPIPGLKDFSGRGVSYCAICDGVFYRGKTVAVLGAGEFAQHEADILSLTAKKVILLTHGQAAPVVDSRYEVHTAPVEAVTGDTRVRGVRLSDGSNVAIDGLFLAWGTAGSADLARRLGAVVEDTHICVDAHMATNVPGLYAAGDCTGGLLQIVKAAHDGAVAGLSILKYLRSTP